MIRIITVFLATLNICANITQAQTHHGAGAGTLGLGHTYYGYNAGSSAIATSTENSFIGSYSGRYTTSGNGNTAAGFRSLEANTTGNWNTAVGGWAMVNNTVGYRNTGVGRGALYYNISGHYNTAHGWNSLFKNSIGVDNTAVGARSLSENAFGNSNVAVGRDALFANTASNNTAIGASALVANTTGTDNVALGYKALEYNTTGRYNTAIGTGTLMGTTGEFNTAVGAFALDHDTSVGCGSQNSAFGYRAGPFQYLIPCDLSNTTALGAYATVTASNQVRIGNTNVTSIGGQVQWTVLSDGRFKKDLKQDVAGLAFINQLNPVSYTFDKKALNAFFRISDERQSLQTRSDDTPRRQVGFVAQEVEAIIAKSGYVFSGVEIPQNENDPYSIRYAEFVVPLVKAVQELSAELDKVKQQLKNYESVSSQSNTNPAGGGAYLYQNSPNPFTATTEIKMEIPDGSSHAQVIIYNLEGKQLKNIQVNERGTTMVRITAHDLSAGMYLYSLMVDGKVADTRRLILTE